VNTPSERGSSRVWRLVSHQAANVESLSCCIREALAPGERPLLELRLHQLPLLVSAFKIDAGERKSALLIDNKWYGAGREKSFGLEFLGAMKEGTLFETISKSFARISDQARSI
jgi:hypothetical protein